MQIDLFPGVRLWRLLWNSSWPAEAFKTTKVLVAIFLGSTVYWLDYYSL